MLNCCVLTGNLGADPEITYSSSGTQVASFNLAFNCGKDKTGWIKCTCFNKLAEVSEKHLHKGARIAVIGALEQEKWETSQGESKTAFKIIANSIEFIKTSKGTDNGQA